MVTKKTTAKKASATTPPVVMEGSGLEGVSKGATKSQNMAALATRPSMAAAFTVKAFSVITSIDENIDEFDIIDELQKAGNEVVVGGDMSRVEKMLANQAISLDNIFNQMAQRSAKQETYKGIEVFLRLALKAQAQARSTAEALALLKNPQPYIRQANIAHGPQQVVNNGARSEQYAQAHAGAGNIQSEQNKLIEADHGQRLDTRAQGAAGGANPHMATVEAINRA